MDLISHRACHGFPLNHGGVALGEAQCRARNAAVDGDSRDGPAGDVHLFIGNGQVVFDGLGRREGTQNGEGE